MKPLYATLCRETFYIGGTMSVSKRNRRKIHVRDQLFLWWVNDTTDGEGFWVLNVIADANKEHRFCYELYETGLAAIAQRNNGIPLPQSFDPITLVLTDATTTAIGTDRHLSPTPAFVRQLIEWHMYAVW